MGRKLNMNKFSKKEKKQLTSFLEKLGLNENSSLKEIDKKLNFKFNSKVTLSREKKYENDIRKCLDDFFVILSRFGDVHYDYDAKNVDWFVVSFTSFQLQDFLNLLCKDGSFFMRISRAFEFTWEKYEHSGNILRGKTNKNYKQFIVREVMLE